MQNNQKRNGIDAKTLVLGCLAGAGLIFGLAAYVDTRRMAKAINSGIEKVQSLTSVDVSKAVIETAVKKAADREVERAANQIANRSMDMMNREISQRVNDAVREHYGSLSKTVKEALTKKAQEIDITKLREDVVESAKEAIADKFDAKLDGLLEDYNKNLENVGKIYQSIANSMTGASEKAKQTVTLGLG